MTSINRGKRRPQEFFSLRAIRQRLAQIPKEPPEESILLRVMVQALVSVGIIAVDVAAADVTDALGISLWAVPVSAVGAVWSHTRRHKRNIPIKFCIAIAMLGSLAAFFVRLLGDRNDSRLALAELLIQLLVFHSFDIPRRKDLGYSVVIGLILMGVAATLSQTLWFAPLALAFVALAIPVMVLDYRSRLGLTPHPLRQASLELPPRQVGRVLVMIVALGLVIFAVMPRFPGYQLRTFPVSTPIDFDGQFDGSTVINPGYAEGSDDGVGGVVGGSMGSPRTGPGDVDRDFYYGFSNQINMNLRGEMVPKVVMRVRSQAEGFWRVMAFDRYTGQGWQVSRSSDEEIEKLDRPSWTFRFNLPWSVTLGERREVVQSFTVVSDLPNLIPTLYEAKELYFPTRQVGVDAEGALRSPVPLSSGVTYTVVSEVPYRDRTQLRQSAPDYPADIFQNYLQLPEAIAPKIRAETERILARSENPLTDPYETALYLTQYLKQNYRVEPSLPFFEDNEDMVDAFLFKYQGGYPDHFSTTLAVMLRSVGIPARLVAGYAPGEFNPFTGYYVVRNTDAFAMTEVYFNKYGWFAFNPIPGMEAVPSSAEESQTFGVLRRLWNWVAGWLPSPVVGLFESIVDVFLNAVGWAIAQLTALFNRGWVGVLASLVLLTLLGFLSWLGWSGLSQWRYRRWLSKLPPPEALYQQMLKWLSQQGLHKSPAETPLEFVQKAYAHQPMAQASLIEAISHAYVRWRYSGHTPDLRSLRQSLHQLQKRSRRKA
ncbi:transglutaminase TgpA family protein [Leptolyngbya sp. AN02str]|uniref:transglutaminase TgpA family protein n=1 Tax=Leptolyngbya sp. AN02str TaxID=3423363 RepID=UPI003D310245